MQFYSAGKRYAIFQDSARRTRHQCLRRKLPQPSDNREARRGFTLLELLVTISIIAMPMALILPAVQSTRQAARKLQCQNHIRNLGLAIQNYAMTNGQLPTLHAQFDVDRGNGPHPEWSPWPVTLLPNVDQAGVAEAWVRGPQSDLSLSVFTCPSDPNNWRISGGLSYTMNCGYGIYTGCCVSCSSDDSAVGFVETISGGSVAKAKLVTVIVDDLKTAAGYSYVGVGVGTSSSVIGWDWDGDGQVNSLDHQVCKASGVFWNPGESLQIPINLDNISSGDGLSQTFMLAENWKARGWGSVTSLWVPGPNGDLVVSPELSAMSARFLAPIRHKGFGLGTSMFRNSSNEFLFPGTGYTSVPRSPELLSFDALSSEAGQRDRCGSTPKLVPLKTSLVNSGSEFGPNSYHGGRVNLVYCDGHVHFLSQQIDSNVFARLMTSNGTRFGQPMTTAP